jgi:hypothetical protein
MRLISERISIDSTKYFSIVILGKLERWKESLLLFWLLSWTACGTIFLYYFFGDTPFRHNITMLIMISFWLYFELRIGKVFFWRRSGFEQLQFKDDQFTIKNSLLGRGKERIYKVKDLEAFSSIPYSNKNFFSFMDNSFWVYGGDRIYFDYFGKKVVLGKQLKDDEIKKLLQVLNGQLKEVKRAVRKSNKQNQSSL